MHSRQSGSDSFLTRGLALDLETEKEGSRIHRFAAVRCDNGQSFTFTRGKLSASLAELDHFASGAAYLIGHNIIEHDAKVLAAAKPDLALLRLPMVDTLRLSPLAFPRNPYHHLVKHYHDGSLVRAQKNDPKLDCVLTITLLHDQHAAFSALNASDPELLLAFHWLTTEEPGSEGVDALFSEVRHATRPSREQVVAALTGRFGDDMRRTHWSQLCNRLENDSWPLAYALAWLSVAGGNSVMPPWVRHQFPQAARIVRLLRDQACQALDCHWCRTRLNAVAELNRWFDFSAFRAEPKDDAGSPLQQTIVESAMAGDHVLGILPTGTGKSICYQLPALSRYDRTGALTVVISPLVALMADQITGMERKGIANAAALNSLLSMPERIDVLDRVRLGDIAILIISPEQLRSRALRRVLEQREIGGWVLDEAHCLSKWGHDFRPDYRYIGRYIRERAGEDPVPPVLCLTATAKPEVIEEIGEHFRERLGLELRLLDGGSERSNLAFSVIATQAPQKFADVMGVIEQHLPGDQPGGAIVYCATRRATEELADFLRAKGLSAAHFHAGLPPETKKSVQTRFVDGEIRVIAATNAFGMGIDKPDVRLVVHADIPSSLENYLQEAGRAGRDGAPASCVLLYSREDVERQFCMSAGSRLRQQEINAILRALRRIDRKRRLGGEVIATSGEILLSEDDGAFDRDSATDDTRVRTALAWLEEAKLLRRSENSVEVFPSSLLVTSTEQAAQRLRSRKLKPQYEQQLLSIVTALLLSDPDQGVTTDELMGRTGLSPTALCKALHDLEAIGIASNDTPLTAFVHHGVERSSKARLANAMALECAMIEKLRETAPDATKGDTWPLHIRVLSQSLRDDGVADVLPERLRRLLRSFAKDDHPDDAGRGSLALRSIDRDTVGVTLLRDWSALAKTAELRRKAAEHLLTVLLDNVKGATGVDLLAKTTFGALRASLSEDLILRSEVHDIDRLMEHALLWLHEQEVIRINKGLVVFRQAMTIRLDERGGSFLKADFEPLLQHYDEQTLQIHVMAEYAQRGLESGRDAMRLAVDYFTLGRGEFLERWLPGRHKEIQRQTLPETWRTIVESLRDPVQQRIVQDDRERTNVLVLAGPGSGKTRVLVHRIAYLVRVRRENPRGILALAYNRHAAVEIRERLAALIGDDARRVTVLTCHAMAMRLTGHCLTGKRLSLDDEGFRDIIRQAAALVRGEGLAPDEADAQRERLLEGYRWILVDEYQDIEAEQYELIAALAGRTRADEDGRLSLFAVGDDDQNIYSFAGASVAYIRRFEEDYAARPAWLTDNYRSTRHIIDTANHIIAPAHNRMKERHPIRIDRRRESVPPGGVLAKQDPMAAGRVQVLKVGGDPVLQAIGVMTELKRLASLVPDWNWAKVAVIARDWAALEPVRSFCDMHGIAAQSAQDAKGSLWRLREVQALADHAHNRAGPLVDAAQLRAWLATQPDGPHWAALRDALDDYALETGGTEQPRQRFIEWLVEWCRDARRRQRGLLLVTAHSAKGLEFDHVAVLDGDWMRYGKGEDPDAPRRLYYVAMTRARQSLLLARADGGGVVACDGDGRRSKAHGHTPSHLLDELLAGPAVVFRDAAEMDEVAPELRRVRRRLTPADVNLGFAGRFGHSHPVHARIAGLSAGDALTLRENDGRRELLDAAGHPVGRLAKAFAMPAGMRCIAASVAAVLVRSEEDSQPEYREQLRCARWEVVIPELVLEPMDPVDYERRRAVSLALHGERLVADR